MSSLGGINGSQQSWPTYTPPTFSQLDTNSDGGISLSEFEADGPQGTSGTSDSSTASAAQQQKAQALFDKIDTNGDGSISSDELSAFQAQAQQGALLGTGQGALQIAAQQTDVGLELEHDALAPCRVGELGVLEGGVGPFDGVLLASL